MHNFLALVRAFFVWLCLFVVVAAAPAPAPSRIAFVSDTHCTRSTLEDRPLYRGRFDKVIAAVNAARVDLVLLAGDLTQDGKPEEIADFHAQLRKFRAPAWCVLGNHDCGSKWFPKAEDPLTAARLARCERALAPSFFARTRAGVRVVGVNSALFGTGLPREQAQWQFLEKEFARPATRPTLLLTHYPLFVKTPDEPGGDYWNIEPEPRARLLELLRAGQVRAVLSGHLHKPLTNHVAGIQMIGTHPVSFGLPRGRQKQGWTLLTVPPTGAVQAELRYIED
jgi:3',5'-cyclic AMP phosphodiesterase CpdA